MDTADYYTDTCRRFFELRMQLLPYLYSAFVEYNKWGTPPVRALVLEYPEDEKVSVIDDEYMFGSSLLVCPLTLEDGIQRQVYLPEGTWYHFFTGETVTGGSSFTVAAGYDQIPVFVKDNSLIPLAKPVLCIKDDTVFEIDIKVYGKGNTEFTLYEDDFETFAYENGGMNEVVIHQDAEGNRTIKRTGFGNERYIILD